MGKADSADLLSVFHMLPSGGGAGLAARNLQLLAGRFSITVHGVEGGLRLPAPPGVVTREYPFPEGRRLAGFRRLFAPWVLQGRLRAFREVCRSAAREMNSGGGRVLVHNSMVIAAPPVLDYLEGPSLYFCYEYPRHLYEKEGVNRTGSRLGDLLLAPLERAERREDLYSAGRADRVATFSPYMAGRILEIYGIRAAMLFPGVDFSFFAPEPGWSAGEHLLSVGALWPFKGHDLALRAVALLPRATRPPVVIAADREFPGHGRRLARLAASLGVDLTIRMNVSDEELLALYRNALAVLCFQKNEPYGLVPLEAMACGRPVIARNSGGLADNVVHGENGLLVEDGSEVSAAEAVARIVSDRELAKALGARGRDFVTAHRTPSEYAGRLADLLAS